MILFLVSIGAFAFSLLISWAASGLIEPIIFIPKLFTLNLSYNAGVAFGINIPSPLEEILIVSALFVLSVFAFRSASSRLASIGFGLILGGAIANQIDRFADGFVTDYISVGTFPIFNAADSCITIGVLLVLIEAWTKRTKKP